MATRKQTTKAVEKVEESTFSVLRDFFDSTDGMRLYRVGDIYPRAGLKPSVERIRYLMMDKNGFIR